MQISNGVKKKILIVEDEKTLRFLLAQALTEEDFEVEEAVDGEEGIQKLKENKMDMVLLDIILPGIDGFEVLARIKKDPRLESTPVIILSNLGQKEEIERGLKLGAVDYLIKANFDLNKIVERIRSILG